ncbi:MAG: response regulator transcription factor [Desulfuromonadales bacterium]|nr:response regulator transcription factor [Desulfuromonadales bacterium]
MSLKILVVDDHTIVREGLRALIDKEADMQVINEAGTGTEAVRIARGCCHDVIVMDISMPDMNGIDATRLILKECPNTHILALSMEADRRFVVEVLKSGASGYLLKDVAFAELAKAIRTVAAGETYLTPRITEVIVREYLQRIPQEELLTCESLTPREREILRMIADGKNPKEIAYAGNVSIKTIENQRNGIMKKLNLFSIAELTKYAIREGLTNLD